jgi:prepilin-type N-terminal cleavage/methylation domain-containing protein/prepilin-type processing-associated H-X9-DG protein
MRRTGLTLIELLVVISIIAILMAILIPALGSSREEAEAVLCGSNVKQLLLGLLGYETENQTFPYGFDDTPVNPPSGGYPGGHTYDRMGWWWFNHIEGFYKKSAGTRTVVQCPSKRLDDSRLKSNILCGNYGVNRSVCKSPDDIPSRGQEFVGTPLRSSDIPHPGRTLLVTDSGYSMISWWHASDVPPVSLGATIEDTAYVPGLEINKGKGLWPGQKWDAINGRHSNKTVNVGFADGHADRVKAEGLLVEKTADGYRNKSPLWQPN